MRRAVSNRLRRLEAVVGSADALVYVIPARTDDEFEERRASLMRATGAAASDTFLRVHGYETPEPVSTGMTMAALFAHIAAEGRKVYEPTRERRAR